jgi:hypothetical protein
VRRNLHSIFFHARSVSPPPASVADCFDQRFGTLHVEALEGLLSVYFVKGRNR